MGIRKQTRKYFFSVEGQTELWYLEWLASVINDDISSKYNVKFKVQKKEPLKYSKTISILSKTEVVHIVDMEGSSPVDIKKFQQVLYYMKKAQEQKSGIKYILGYSNLTFELWIILHKQQCNTAVADKKQYLTLLNRAFNENFESLSQYKEEDNFKRLLSRLELADVRFAINNAKTIMVNNAAKGCILNKYKGYSYYLNNPSLSLGDIINKILKECF